jgi:hypothetical protein
LYALTSECINAHCLYPDDTVNSVELSPIDKIKSSTGRYTRPSIDRGALYLVQAVKGAVNAAFSLIFSSSRKKQNADVHQLYRAYGDNLTILTPSIISIRITRNVLFSLCSTVFFAVEKYGVYLRALRAMNISEFFRESVFDKEYIHGYFISYVCKITSQ